MMKHNLSIENRGAFGIKLSIFRFAHLIVFVVAAFPALGQVNASSAKNRKMILRDEGLSQLSYVDLAKPSNNWYVPVPAGRDLQLVGNGRVLIGTGTGYEEHEILTGKKVAELTTFNGTIAATRLRNGNTMLTGLDWEGKKGIVLAEVDATGKTKRLINFPEFPYVRLVRETMSGTFIITSDTIVFEGDANGKIVWRSKFVNTTKPFRTSMHAWLALRLENGNTVSSTGFGANLQIVAKNGSLVKMITGPEEVHPYFFAGFQILKNGNFVVSNWQGHGTDHGSSGNQVLEYSPDGKLVWSWKQDPSKFSSLQGVIVLDGLNLKKLHVEDSNGKLAPVK